MYLRSKELCKITFTKTIKVPKRRLLVSKLLCSDYYSLLGVKSSASTEEIKKIYLQKCKELHPDKNPGDKTLHEKFVKINEAYSVLSNPSKRREYDQRFGMYSQKEQTRQNWRGRSQSTPEDVWRQWERQNQHNWTSRDGFNDFNRTNYRNSSQSPFKSKDFSQRDPLNAYWKRVYNQKQNYQTYNKKHKAYPRNELFNPSVIVIFLSSLCFVLFMRISLASHNLNNQSQRTTFPFSEKDYSNIEFSKRNVDLPISNKNIELEDA